MMLVETCVEGGPLTVAEMREALAGQGRNAVTRAVVSRLEWMIGQVRERGETLGADERTRAECAGGAHELKVLRAWLVGLANGESVAE